MVEVLLKQHVLFCSSKLPLMWYEWVGKLFLVNWWFALLNCLVNCGRSSTTLVKVLCKLALLGYMPSPDIRASFPLALEMDQEECHCWDTSFTCFWGDICTGMTKGFSRRCLFWIQLLCFIETDDYLNRLFIQVSFRHHAILFYFLKGLVRHLSIKVCCIEWWWGLLWNGDAISHSIRGRNALYALFAPT